jgi:hypothetical protein
MPTPGNLLQKHGCPKCAGIPRRTTTQFAKEVEKIHDGRIEILGTYEALAKGVLVGCRTCQYQWKPIANSLIRGHGCPVWPIMDSSQPCPPSSIMSGSVRSTRLASPTGPCANTSTLSDYRRLTVLEVFQFRKGSEALALETEILENNQQHRYLGPDVLKLGGNDELFTCDVLGLDVARKPHAAEKGSSQNLFQNVR